MSEKGKEHAVKTAKEANISDSEVHQTDLEEQLHIKEKIEEVEEMEEEKKSVATSSDAP